MVSRQSRDPARGAEAMKVVKSADLGQLGYSDNFHMATTSNKKSDRLVL